MFPVSDYSPLPAELQALKYTESTSFVCKALVLGGGPKVQSDTETSTLTGYGGNNLADLQPVQNGRLSSTIEPQDENPHLTTAQQASEVAQKPTCWGNVEVEENSSANVE